MSEEEDRTCYVCNFIPEVTSDLLEELFTQVGPVEKLSLTERNSHRFAMVTFEDEESVPFAVETLDGIKLFQTPLTVKPRSGSKHDKRNSDYGGKRDSYGSTHSSPHSESRKRDYMGRAMSYDERMGRSYSGSRQDKSPMFTPPIPPPPPPPPQHSESYPSLKTRTPSRDQECSTPKSSFTGRPGGDQRRTFPSKPSDSRVFDSESNGFDRFHGSGRGNSRGHTGYSRRQNNYSGHRW